MLILSNLPQLRYCQEYLHCINAEFRFVPIGIFEMCGYSPSIIITKTNHEANAAAKAYPDIKFVGNDWRFPNYDLSIPDALLDEISTISAENDNLFPSCDICYFNDKGKENWSFINKLRALGNAKFAGPAFCEDEIFKKYNQRLTPAIYKKASIIGVTNKEEGLKALFMNRVVIAPDYIMPYIYKCDAVTNLNIVPRQDQAKYAWSLSHSIFLSELFAKINDRERSEKILQSIKMED